MSFFGKTLCAIAVALMGVSAQAAITQTYSSRAAFDLATGGTATVETFNAVTEGSSKVIGGQVLDSNTIIDGANLGIKPGVTYQTKVEGAGGFVINTDNAAGFDLGFLTRVDQLLHPLTITFLVPVRFFGFETNGTVGSMFLDIETANDTVTETVTPDPARGISTSFFGYQSDEDIFSLTLGGSNDPAFAIDNFTFLTNTGNTGGNQTPEPGALALMAIALGGLGWSRRRTTR